MDTADISQVLASGGLRPVQKLNTSLRVVQRKGGKKGNQVIGEQALVVLCKWVVGLDLDHRDLMMLNTVVSIKLDHGLLAYLFPDIGKACQDEFQKGGNLVDRGPVAIRLLVKVFRVSCM